MKNSISQGNIWFPSSWRRNGLTDSELTISDKALEKIIHNYTREAGVRNLERRIGEICRKAAREFLEKEEEGSPGNGVQPGKIPGEGKDYL